MWTIDADDEPPVDAEVRELAVTLAAGGPRWVSPDGEFAIWSASLENGRSLTLRGALGHVAAIREVEAFLFAHGIGAGLAARLVRTYGSDVIAVLQADPYRLTEVPRIGFRVADRVARSLGIELDAPQRLRAGLLFTLGEAAS